MKRYYTLKTTELRNYQQLMSELRSLPTRGRQNVPTEEKAAFTVIPMFHALMGKLNFIVNGDVPPSPTPQPMKKQLKKRDNSNVHRRSVINRLDASQAKRHSKTNAVITMTMEKTTTTTTDQPSVFPVVQHRLVRSIVHLLAC